MLPIALLAMSLQDTDGKQHLLPTNKGLECYIFVLAECPIANAYAPEIKRITTQYQKKASFYLVQVDPLLKLEDARKHKQEFGYKIPVLLDPSQALLDKFNAKRSPEAVLLKDGHVVYQGRIDDQYAGWGERRPQTQNLDLRNALDAAWSGKTVKVAKTEAVGCILKH
jgi:hypothetical protein